MRFSAPYNAVGNESAPLSAQLEEYRYVSSTHDTGDGLVFNLLTRKVADIEKGSLSYLTHSQ